VQHQCGVGEHKKGVGVGLSEGKGRILLPWQKYTPGFRARGVYHNISFFLLIIGF
jgi:hypothetical protein